MTTTATATSALDLLHSVHPHHVDRIVTEVEAMRPGTIVRVANTRGGGFYCGLAGGDLAVVTSVSTGDYVYVQRLNGGSNLGLSASDLEVVPAHTYDEAMAQAGKRAAEAHALSLLERAYTSANGLIGVPGTDEVALGALREAHADREFAFALQILSEYAVEARRQAQHAEWVASTRQALSAARS